MLDIDFSLSADKFLRKANIKLAGRLVKRIEKLAEDPFPTDVKRVINRKEKIFRVRMGDYRIQYNMIYEKNLLFVSDIEKRPKAYK